VSIFSLSILFIYCCKKIIINSFLIFCLLLPLGGTNLDEDAFERAHGRVFLFFAAVAAALGVGFSPFLLQ